MYPYGSIVIVSRLLDPQGRNPKDRRCIVLTPDPVEGEESGTIDVVAISSIVPDPLPPHLVPLPWQQPFHPRTKLIKPSVAVCSWLIEVDVGRVSEPVGHVPNAIMARIARTILSLGD